MRFVLIQDKLQRQPSSDFDWFTLFYSLLPDTVRKNRDSVGAPVVKR